MRTGIIYRATNLINGKCYIGQTVNKLSNRIVKHYDSSLSGDYKFAKALKKYKKEELKWEILLEDIAEQYLNEVEIFLIWFHDSYKNGYNSTLGGSDSPTKIPEIARKVSIAMTGKKRSQKTIDKMKMRTGEKSSFFGKKHTEKTKRKMSFSNKRTMLGKHLTEQHRQKLSISNRGEKNHNFGKPLPQEVKDKISDKHALMWKLYKSDGSVEIIKNLEKYCRENKLCANNMRLIAKGKQKQHRGYCGVEKLNGK